MPRVVIGICAAPRPKGADYLPRTLVSLQSQTFADTRVTVFAEPGTVVPGSVDCRVADRRLGTWHNWRRAATQLLADSDSDFIITMEDDTVLHPDAVQRAVAAVGDAVVANFGFISLYTSGRYQRQHKTLYNDGTEDLYLMSMWAKRALRRRGGRGRVVSYSPPPGPQHLAIDKLWGACCLFWSRSALQATVAHPAADAWQGLKPNEPYPTGTDIVIGRIVKELQLPMYFWQPSLCEHVGEVSSVGNRGLVKDRKSLFVEDFTHVGSDR